MYVLALNVRSDNNFKEIFLRFWKKTHVRLFTKKKERTYFPFIRTFMSLSQLKRRENWMNVTWYVTLHRGRHTLAQVGRSCCLPRVSSQRKYRQTRCRMEKAKLPRCIVRAVLMIRDWYKKKQFAPRTCVYAQRHHRLREPDWPRVKMSDGERDDDVVGEGTTVSHVLLIPGIRKTAVAFVRKYREQHRIAWPHVAADRT